MTAKIRIEEKRLRPGSVLRGSVLLAPESGDEKNKVELSVLWETAGKGDTDRGIVLFRVLAEDDPVRARAETKFEAPLPLLPVSYTGKLLQVRWLVRVRRLRASSNDDLYEESFSVEPSE
jgi:hypothetical protein